MASAIDQLRWAVQALALPASEQIRLFPSFVCVADELALDFSHWFEVASDGGELTSEQRVALQHLDDTLAAFSGSEHPDVWTEEALHAHPTWVQFRQQASAFLAAFDWPYEPPPSNRAIYVGPGNA